MEKRDVIKAVGIVREVMPNAMFRVALETGDEVVCHMSSQGRVRLTRLLPGDMVAVALSPYDPGRGSIIDSGEAKGRAL